MHPNGPTPYSRSVTRAEWLVLKPLASTNLRNLRDSKDTPASAPSFLPIGGDKNPSDRPRISAHPRQMGIHVDIILHPILYIMQRNILTRTSSQHIVYHILA